MSDEYQEFPKVMIHPGFQPATLGTSDDARRGIPGHKGSPVKLPPVTVENAAQEEYHASQGYIVSGVPNPAAYFAAKQAPDAAAPDFQEYPKWVRGRIVNSLAEENEALAEPVAPAVADQSLVDIATLEFPPDAQLSARIAELEAQVEYLQRELRDSHRALEVFKLAAARPEAAPAQVREVKAPRAIDNAPDMQRRADAAGLLVDRRWSADRLRREVVAAERKKAAADAAEPDEEEAA